MKVSVMIAGVGARSFTLEEGAKVSDLVRDFRGEMPALGKIETFYVDRKPVSQDFVLSEGNIVSGAPKAEGGN